MRDDMQFACLPRRGAGGLRRGRRIAYSMVRGKIDSATMVHIDPSEILLYGRSCAGQIAARHERPEPRARRPAR